MIYQGKGTRLSEATREGLKNIAYPGPDEKVVGQI